VPIALLRRHRPRSRSPPVHARGVLLHPNRRKTVHRAGVPNGWNRRTAYTVPTWLALPAYRWLTCTLSILVSTEIVRVCGQATPIASGPPLSKLLLRQRQRPESVLRPQHCLRPAPAVLLRRNKPKIVHLAGVLNGSNRKMALTVPIWPLQRVYL
jgi:hypothetical protein